MPSVDRRQVFAGLAAQEHHPDGARHAMRLIGAAEVRREVVDSPLTPFDCPICYRSLPTVRARLDEAASAAKWAEGRAMPLEQAIAYALEETG